jgi:hypothetical protein
MMATNNTRIVMKEKRTVMKEKKIIMTMSILKRREKMLMDIRRLTCMKRGLASRLRGFKV